MSDSPLLPSNPSINLSNCDREPIHIPGCIQPHGVLIVLQPPDLTILQISRNCEQWWPQKAESFLNQNLAAFLTAPDIELIGHCSQESYIEVFNPFTVTLTPSGRQVEGRLYRTETLLVLELEPPLKDQPSHPVSFYPWVKKAIATIQTAPNFTIAVDRLAQQIRTMTQYDRVMIYRFEPDESGVVVAEAKKDSLESYLDLHYPASDIPQQARRLYRQNWLRVISDVNYQPSAILPTINPVTHKPLDLSDSVLRSVSPIHIEYLQNMGVTATLTISLLHEGRLWGLICAHHYQPKYIDGETRKACEFLGQFMSVELFKRRQQDLAQSQAKIAVIQKYLQENLTSESDFIEGILQQKHEDLLDFVEASGLVLALGDRLVTIGQTPPKKAVRGFLQWLRQHHNDEVFHTQCLQDVYPKAKGWIQQAAGALAIAVDVKQIIYQMVWFRPEVVQTVTWGGDPRKPVTVTEQGEVRLSPRKSFAAWQETVTHQSIPWTALEIETVSQLRNTLMMAALTFSQTALAETAKRADVANRMKSEFLANMSHEIRTPMNAILGFCDLLQGIMVEPHQKQYLEAIASSGKSLLRLIDDILDLSKIEAGKLELNYEPLYLRRILLEIKQIFTQKAKNKGLTLRLEVDHLLDWGIEFDEMRLRQILFNLVGNALKFTEQGQVTIAGVSQLYDDNRKLWLKISVKDTGIGISRDRQQQIFDAFVQSEGQSTRKYGGTGLGLTITRRLTEMLGGYVFLRSQLKQGSEFSLIFPEIQTMQPEWNPNISSPDNIHLQQLAPATILIADDVQSNLDVLAGYFHNTDHQLLFARNGREAVEMAIIHQPDIILMDLLMPILDGEEASYQLKNNPLTQAIPIAILTASITPQQALEAQQHYQAFLRKPFTQQQLALVLKRFLPLKNEAAIATATRVCESRINACNPEVITALENIQQTLWQDVSQTLTRRKVIAFLESLQDLIQDNSCWVLEEYVQLLQNQLSAFDWQHLPHTIEQFPQLCYSLRQQRASHPET